MRARANQPIRRLSANRVKQAATYDVAEMAKLLGTHRNTVRRWLKNGLKPIDGNRPVLVLGAELKAYLARRKAVRRQSCATGEFFCFRCRVPRRAAADMADLRPRTEKVFALMALCAFCATPMHRTIRRADLPKLAALYDLRTLPPERLSECPRPSPNGDKQEE